jgi:cell division protein FtsB
MSRVSPVQSILRSAGLPAIALIAMGFFGYYAVLGPNGVFALREFKNQVKARTVEYQALDKHRAEIRNRVNLLDPSKGADPDMVEELVRKQLNVARRDEVIVPLKKK